MKLCKPIIHNFQEAEVLNAHKIVIEVKVAIDNIIQISNSVLDKCNKVKAQLENQSGNVSEVNMVDSVVEYDPGKRTKIVTHNQRQYLIMLGLHQPKLNLYRRTEKYSFKYSWFEEYPHLEYSTVKDAAFCYVYCLLKKVGKLQKHFISKTHKAALYEFCHFMNKNNHIDVMLDKN